MNATVTNGMIAGTAALLLSAIVSPLFGARRRLAGWLNFLFALAAGIAFAAAAAGAFAGGGGSAVLRIGGASLHLLVDPLSSLFLLLVSFMGIVAAFYSIGYMEHYAKYRLSGYYLHYPLFLLGMIAIVTVDDLSIGFTIAWQLMTISSFFLIRFDRDDPSIVRSANKYLVLMEAAWLLIVIGAALVSRGALGEPIHRLASELASAAPHRRGAVYPLLLLGFGLKAGVFPLGQLWLPDAHSSAPSPISALLSGVMIKTGAYGIVRTLFWMFPRGGGGAGAFDWGLLVASFGAATLFLGTVQALKQHDAKRLHAYHSIGQMGYIILGVGAAHCFLLRGGPVLSSLAVLALVGAMYHTINHAVFKGLLFLCTGSVQYATGTKDLDRLGGLIRRMPVTATLAAVASASIAGVPAFSGFMSKWAVIASGLLAGKDAGVFVFFGLIALMTSAVTLASYVKFFGMTFTSSGVEWSGGSEPREVGPLMLLPQAALAGIAVLQGLFPWPFVAWILRVFERSDGSIVQPLFAEAAPWSTIGGSALGIGLFRPGGGAAASAAPVLILALLVAAGAFALFFRRSCAGATRRTEPWLCGYRDLADSTRYRSRDLYAPFKSFMRWTGGNDRGAPPGGPNHG